MLKKEVRKIYRQKRDEISHNEKMKWDDLLLIQFQTIELPYIDYVLSFYPIEDYMEVNTFHITDFLRFRNPGLHICYPRTNKEDLTMEAIVCHPDSMFEINQWNIPEPTHNEPADPALMDVVLIPLLAFDTRGVRVGYGKGFYDRFLAQCRPDCVKIGLSFFEAVDVIEDAADFDVPLDFCITPERVYVF
jgi:5-formyltetrahydrofolate cyclo-ligase